MVLVPAVWSRGLPPWPASFSAEDFDAQREESDYQYVEEPRNQRKPKQQDDSPYDSEDYVSESDTRSSSSSGAGYYGGFSPKAIVLRDDQSIEARFPFPEFPK